MADVEGMVDMWGVVRGGGEEEEGAGGRESEVRH